MKVRFLDNDITVEQIVTWLEQYAGLGPLPGILLPFLEAILPFLPLVLFVMGNAAAFGLWQGFLFSWIGTCLGALFVFFLVRKFKNTRLFLFLRKRKQFTRLANWVQRHGFGPLFLLFCFPFSPSALINLVAALSEVSKKQFTLAVLLGKLVMVFFVSLVGQDIISLIREPQKLLILLVVIGVMWVIGKVIERRIQAE
ncbi:TVP38/TMEM64 family protein [Bacillus tianshenii]|nr:TVP38/TMEM64 family protein [Bacillus tianshenii]